MCSFLGDLLPRQPPPPAPDAFHVRSFLEALFARRSKGSQAQHLLCVLGPLQSFISFDLQKKNYQLVLAVGKQGGKHLFMSPRATWRVRAALALFH